MQKGGIIIDVLLMIWAVIESTLFLLSLPVFRNKINKQSNEVWKRSIHTNKSRVEIIFLKLKEIFICVSIVGIAYVFFNSISNNAIQIIMRWCQGTFIVAFLPIIITWIQEKNSKIKTSWHFILLLIGLVISIFSYSINIDSLEEIEEYNTYIVVILSVFVAVFILSIFKIFGNNQVKSANKTHICIRKDLFHRTPNLNLTNLDGLELIKMCERYFDEYSKCYRKLDNLKRVEYVNLYGVYRDLWYKRAATIMKKALLISILILVLKVIFNYEVKVIINLTIMFLYYLNIAFLKRFDKNFLDRLAIRYFYDEWGYCLYYQDKCKFAGNVQIIEFSKNHKFVHSVLDIAALSRAVAFNDRINGTEMIKIISNSFYELFDIYSDEKKSNWLEILPLWLISLFEFSICGKVSQDIRSKLGGYCENPIERQEINMFLFSFWIDIKRHMPDRGISEFISKFMLEINTES